jgi:YjjG family noncanonical pyrimidine nucleotidase
MKRRYDNLIFDLDDTILDFTKGEEIGLTAVIEQHGLPASEEVVSAYQQINAQVWQNIENGGNRQELLNTRFSNLFSVFGMVADGVQLEAEYRQYLNRNYNVIDHAAEVLTGLRLSGFKLIAGTNGVAATQRQRLRESKMGQFFDEVFISEEIGASKPSSDFYQAIFDGVPSLTKENTVMLGDGLKPDILGARAFGIDQIWVNVYHRPNENNIAIDKSVTDLRDIPRLLIVP